MKQFPFACWIVACSFLLTLPFASGCGRGPDVARITGTVTHQGEPVGGIQVNFYPDEGRVSHGTTDAEGRYTLQYSPGVEGAEFGRHRVWISYFPESLEEEMAIYEGRQQFDDQIAAILTKYGNVETTPLTVEVTGNETIDLQLD